MVAFHACEDANALIYWQEAVKEDSSMTTFHCDRCKSTITGNRSVLTATRGELAVAHVEELALADGADLCASCAFLDWMRTGNPHQSDHAAIGEALADTAVASAGFSTPCV